MIRKRPAKDGSVSFYVYVPGGNGRQKYIGAFGSRKDAKDAEQEHAVTQRKIAAGELPAEVDLDRTFKDAATDWLASLEQRGSRSHGQYKVRVTRYLQPTLGSVPITKITKANVMALRDEQATRFAPATVNGNLVCLSSAFSYFIDRQWLDKNPCRGVQPVESPDRIYTWIQTHDEITKLLLECPKGIREIATVAVGTGMRLDEILHLQWVDVDIERRLITVHRGRQGTVKSGKARRIPILDAVLPLLRELALKRGGAELVFPGESPRLGGTAKPRTKPGVWFPFKQAVERAGLPKELRFHDLRHTFASHWVLDGGDIFRLSKILGHSSVVITQRTYAHLVPEMWERDYGRVSFTLPDSGAVYAMTKRKPTRAAQPSGEQRLRMVP
jgi:integrase